VPFSLRENGGIETETQPDLPVRPEGRLRRGSGPERAAIGRPADPDRDMGAGPGQAGPGQTGPVAPAGVSAPFGSVRPRAGFAPGPAGADLPTPHPAVVRLDRGSRRGDDGGRSETRVVRRRTVRCAREPPRTPPDP
jgi:hypothetical protein